MVYGNNAAAQYEQLLRTAPSASLQKMHGDAFAKLNPTQLELIFEELLRGAQAPDERPVSANPYLLATAATLVEQRRPGTLTRMFDDLSSNPLWNLPGSNFFGIFIGIASGAGFILGF